MGHLHGAIFVKIPGIDGESADANHDKWIDVLSIDSEIITPVTAPGSPTARAQHGDIKIIKRVDKASPLLLGAGSTGQTVSDVVIDVTGTGTDRHPGPYFQYRLREAIVTSFSASQESDFPIEIISMNYSRVDWMYQEFKDDGSKGLTVEAWWDVPLNEGGSSTTQPNRAPTIDPIGAQNVTPGEYREVTVTVGDAETPPSELVVTATTTRTDLVRDLALSGTGSTRTLSFRASGLYSGSASVNVKVSDGTTTSSTAFAVLIDVEMTPFESFLAAYFTPEELDEGILSNPIGDPDNDQMVTLLEYALGTNPREFTHPDEAIQITRESRPEGEFIIIRYRSRADDPGVGPIPWIASESMSFTSLENNPLYEESNLGGDNPLYDDIEGIINTGGEADAHFIRLQVELVE
jgi:type VI secretion system Hcp family effector